MFNVTFKSACGDEYDEKFVWSTGVVEFILEHGGNIDSFSLEPIA